MTRSLHVTHINTHDVAGGAAKVAWRLADAMNRRGDRAGLLVGTRRSRDPMVSEFTPAPDPELIDGCRRDGLLYYEYQGSHGLTDHPAVRNADVLHLHNLHGGYFNPFSLPILTRAKPTVWTLHDMQAITGHCAHSFDCEGWKDGCRGCPCLATEPAIAVDRAAERWADKRRIYAHSCLWVVTPSRWLEEKVRQSILREHPIAVIPNGIDTAVFRPHDKAAARKRLGIDPDVFVIGAVGHGGALGNPWKGGRYTEAVLDRLLRDDRGIRFLNVGGGGSDARPGVIPIPSVRDESVLAQIYSAMDAFLYTPIADNCPLVVLEAMACGLPVVTFGVGGIPELVEDGATGVVAPFEDVGGLYRGIRELIAAPEAAQTLGRAARARVEAGYRHADVADRYRALYDNAVSDHPSRIAALRPMASTDIPAVVRTRSFLDMAARSGVVEDAGRPVVPLSSDSRHEQTAGIGAVPKITIVTPSLNQGEYLEACLDSVLSQGYPNLEFVVIDGGSTDGSVEIIKRYAERLTYWHSRPDAGQYAAIQFGFEKSSGGIMGWLNSDDMLHPGALFTVAAVFRARSDIEWITGRPNSFDAGGRQQWVMRDLPIWARKKYLEKQYDTPFIQQESTFWRRSLWRRAGGRLDTQWRLAGDLELWARFFRHARLVSVDALLGGYRIHAGQRAQTFMTEYRSEADAILDRECRLRNGSGEPIRSAPFPLSQEDITVCRKQFDDLFGLSAAPIEPTSTGSGPRPFDGRQNKESAMVAPMQTHSTPPAPDYPEIESLIDAGRIDAAFETMTEYLIGHPESARGHYDLGLLRYRIKDSIGAAEALETAVELAPDAGDYRRSLADVYYAGLRDGERAMGQYVEILKRDPRDVATLLMVGHICVSLEQFEDALHFYDRVLEAEPWHEEARKFKDAVQARIASGGSSNPDAALAEAGRLMDAGDESGAVRVLEDLVAAQPGLAMAHNDLGMLLARRGDNEGACRHYEAAANLEPENVGFQKNLADLYYAGMGRVEEGLAHFAKVLELAPRDIETLLIVGHICVSLEQFEDARHFYQRILDEDPGHADARRFLDAVDRRLAEPSPPADPQELYAEAQECVGRDDTERAIILLEAALAADPGFATAANDLGVLTYQQGDKAAAESHYREAVALAPENTIFSKNLADFLAVEKGEIEEALKIYVRILETEPRDVEALMGTGRICMAIEHHADAEHFFNRVLEVEPWNADAREWMSRLPGRA